MKVVDEDGEVGWSHPAHAPAWAATQSHVLEALGSDACRVASYTQCQSLAQMGLLDEDLREYFRDSKLLYAEICDRHQVDDQVLTDARELVDLARGNVPDGARYIVLHDEVLRVADQRGAIAFTALVATWLALLEYEILHVLEPAGTA